MRALLAILISTQIFVSGRAADEEVVPEPILNRVKRVIGGEEANLGEFPYLAAIRGKYVTKRIFGIPIRSQKFYCGASLISDQWILTAAHCIIADDNGRIYDMRAGKHWKVRLSAIRISSSLKQKLKNVLGKLFRKKSWWQHEYKVEKVFVHPFYNSKNIDNDIGLLKLTKKVPYKTADNIDLVSLPDSTVGAAWPRVGQTCRFVGWGCQQRGGSVSKKAYKLEMPVIKNSRCYSTYSRYFVNDDDFCAGYYHAGKSICQGDSGGALVCDDPAGRPRVAGIASALHGERPGSFPAIFTRVSTHLTWAKEIMREN